MTKSSGIDQRRAACQRGQWAEQVALDHLLQQGLELLEQNYRAPCGEIDLIMQDRNTIVFIEVRHRARKHFMTALETIDRRKLGRIMRSGEHYLQRRCQSDYSQCRFDIVTVEGQTERPGIEWLPDAYRP